MKKDKKKKVKKKIDKELLKLIIISILLFIYGLLVFKENRFIFSFILGCAPYGYSLLDFLGEDKFKKFGKLDYLFSFFTRVVLGLFIGVVALFVKIGMYLVEEDNI